MNKQTMNAQTEEEVLDSFWYEASIEASEADGPNSPDYESLVEKIYNRKSEAYWASTPVKS